MNRYQIRWANFAWEKPGTNNFLKGITGIGIVFFAFSLFLVFAIPWIINITIPGFAICFIIFFSSTKASRWKKKLPEYQKTVFEEKVKKQQELLEEIESKDSSLISLVNEAHLKLTRAKTTKDLESATEFIRKVRNLHFKQKEYMEAPQIIKKLRAELGLPP